MIQSCGLMLKSLKTWGILYGTISICMYVITYECKNPSLPTAAVLEGKYILLCIVQLCINLTNIDNQGYNFYKPHTYSSVYAAT